MFAASHRPGVGGSSDADLARRLEAAVAAGLELAKRDTSGSPQSSHRAMPHSAGSPRSPGGASVPEGPRAMLGPGPAPRALSMDGEARGSEGQGSGPALAPRPGRGGADNPAAVLLDILEAAGAGRRGATGRAGGVGPEAAGLGQARGQGSAGDSTAGAGSGGAAVRPHAAPLQGPADLGPVRPALAVALGAQSGLPDLPAGHVGDSLPGAGQPAAPFGGQAPVTGGGGSSRRSPNNRLPLDSRGAASSGEALGDGGTMPTRANLGTSDGSGSSGEARVGGSSHRPPDSPWPERVSEAPDSPRRMESGSVQGVGSGAGPAGDGGAAAAPRHVSAHPRQGSPASADSPPGMAAAAAAAAAGAGASSAAGVMRRSPEPGSGARLPSPRLGLRSAAAAAEPAAPPVADTPSAGAGSVSRGPAGAPSGLGLPAPAGGLAQRDSGKAAAAQAREQGPGSGGLQQLSVPKASAQAVRHAEGFAPTVANSCFS